jgi:HD-GYP domain-containing protein (c-di-GMP phosphodiesterase class II)
MGGLYFIRDLDSRNGTYVNDRRITEVVLRADDQIRIGETVLLFLDREDSARSRVLRIHDGSGTLDSVKFRDTMVGVQSPPKPLEKKSARKNLTRRVAELIAGETDEQAVFEQVVREAGEAFESDRTDILWIDSSEPELRFRSLASFDTKKEGEIAMSRTILLEAMERREAILCSNAASDQRFGEAQSILLHAIRSVICVPIVVAGTPIAVLYISNSQRADAFDRDDLDLAVQVGLQLSALLGMLKVFESREAMLRRTVLLAVRAGMERKGAREGEQGPGEEDLKAFEASASVARYSQAIAQAFGLPLDQAMGAWVAGAIHNLKAPADGASREGSRKLAAGISGLDPILDAVECQDERHDGSGKPKGRMGDEIPILGRVLSLAKELDRLTRSGGAQGTGLSLEQALAALRETAGEKFQADIVQACLVAHRSGKLASR